MVTLYGGGNSNVRIGLWVDDLQLGVKPGLQAGAALGVEAAGLDAFGPEIAPRVLGRSGRRDLAQYVRSRGVALSALCADVGGRRLADSQTLDVNLGRLREALQLAADLGAPYLVVPAGYVPPKTEKENSGAAALAEATQALVACASTLGVRVCWQAGNEAPEVLQEFLDKHDPSGVLAVDLNPGGYVMRGFEPQQALRLLSARVVVARAADQYRGGGEAPFGEGDVRWGELMIAFSGLAPPAPLALLAACSRAGGRVGSMSAAVRRLQALRVNPLG